MTKKSAGILLYRFKDGHVEIFLVHYGGPFWANKDEGAWTIPKGELMEGEEPLSAAFREFREETGQELKPSDLIELTPVKQKGGKIIVSWGMQGDIDPSLVKSNLFEMEWPPGSGKKKSFPETDKGEWFGMEDAKIKINHAQIALIEELLTHLAANRC